MIDRVIYSKDRPRWPSETPKIESADYDTIEQYLDAKMTAIEEFQKRQFVDLLARAKAQNSPENIDRFYDFVQGLCDTNVRLLADVEKLKSILEANRVATGIISDQLAKLEARWFVRLAKWLGIA